MCAFSSGAPPRVMLCRTPLAAKRVRGTASPETRCRDRCERSDRRRGRRRRSAASTTARVNTRVPRRREPPGQHPTRALIQDHGQVPPATARRARYVTIAHPDLIRPRRLGPSHVIRLPTEPAMRARLRPIDAHDPGPQAVRPHQPLDAPTTDAMATRGKALMNPRTAVGPAAVLEDHTHLFEKNPVLPPTRTDRPLPPRVVTPPA